MTLSSVGGDTLDVYSLGAYIEQYCLSLLKNTFGEGVDHMALLAPMQIAAPVQRTLSTVEQFCQRHPAFRIGGIRWLLFNRETNGLKAAVVKIGKRVLIDEEAFFAWIEAQQRRLPEGNADESAP